MEVENNIYIDNMELINLSVKYSFFALGAGEYGERLINEMKGLIDIVAVADSYKSKGDINGVPIISFEDLLKQKKDNHKIIISTIKYANELKRILEDIGYIAEKDFYIWDDDCYYHCNKMVQSYIEHNKKVWKSDNSKKENQVIIPYSPIHDVSSVTCAYCGHYLAEKYDADIYCVPFRLESEINEIVWQVYQSFDVKDILSFTLSQKREREADEIAENIWASIESIEDWNKISIFGIKFGTTLIRHYLRYYTPSIDLKDLRIKQWFQQTIRKIVFLYDYINNNNVKAIVLWDGVRCEGYLRDIAITKGIPVYAIHYTNAAKLTLDYASGKPFNYYKVFWNQLSKEEQEYGLKWAKEHLDSRLNGGEEDVPYMKGRSPYALKRIQDVLEKNNKIKILICPHSFEDDSFLWGEQIFDNNMWEWLCHLGELSEIRKDYDWYIKMHPSASKRDFEIIDILVKKYSNIKMITHKVSPMQLKDEGIDVVLTIAGTVGHEYPMFGIPVINAGVNPHMMFGFDYNPKTKEEYDALINNLKDIKKTFDIEEIYQFYCIHYLYYKRCRAWIPFKFFNNPELHSVSYAGSKTNQKVGPHRYRLFLEEWSEERHEEIKKNVVELFEWLDAWKENTFYR